MFNEVSSQLETVDRDKRIEGEVIKLKNLIEFICSTHPKRERTYPTVDIAPLYMSTDTVELIDVLRNNPSQYRARTLRMTNNKSVQSGYTNDSLHRTPDFVTATRILEISEKGRKKDKMKFEIRSNWQENERPVFDEPIPQKKDNEFEYLAVYFGQKKKPLTFPIHEISEETQYDRVLIELEAIVKRLSVLAKKEIPVESENVDKILAQTAEDLMKTLETRTAYLK